MITIDYDAKASCHNAIGRMKRSMARTAKDPQNDKEVFARSVKERQDGTPISGPLLSISAQKLHNNLSIDNCNDCFASKC